MVGLIRSAQEVIHRQHERSHFPASSFATNLTTGDSLPIMTDAYSIIPRAGVKRRVNVLGRSRQGIEVPYVLHGFIHFFPQRSRTYG